MLSDVIDEKLMSQKLIMFYIIKKPFYADIKETGVKKPYERRYR